MAVEVVEPSVRQEGVAVSYESAKFLSFYQDAKKLSKGEMVVPRMISVWPTHYCNLACDYCLYAWTHKQGKGIDEEKFHKFIDEVADLGVESLEFAGGGEPLLHPKISEFAKHAFDRGLKVGTLTNGTKMDIENLVKCFSYVRVGIDAHTDELYAKVKSPKAPNMLDAVVKNTMELLRVRGEAKTPRVGFKFLLGNKNCEYVDSFVRFSKEIGVDYCHFKAEHNSPGELSTYERDITDKRVKNLKAQFPKFVLGSVMKLRATVPCFMAPIHSVMDAHGNLLVCCYFNLPEKNSFGNALADGFKKVWFSDKHWEMQRAFTVKECDQFDCRWHIINTEMKAILSENRYDMAFV